MPITYRAGLIGAGQICRFHVAALRRAGIEIVGLCDIEPSRARAAGAALDVPVMDSPEALAGAGANVMHVLTPPATHCQVALRAMDLGCHVLVEKPLAVDEEECRLIERKADATSLRVCVNHSLLFDPQVRRAIDAVQRGKLGRVVSVDILRSSVYPPYGGGPLPPHYREAGYPFRDLGVHALYLLETFLGPIENVSADWKSLGGDPNLAFDEWRAQVRCRDGLGQVQLSWNVRPVQSQIIIQGTRGVLRADLFLMSRALRSALPLPRAAERVVNALSDSLQPLADLPRGIWGVVRKKVLPYHGLQDLVRAFYQSLADNSPVPVSASDAARVVRWTEHVARAAEADHAAQIAQVTRPFTAKCVVTGASGALGRAIVHKLRSDGHRVRAFFRRVPDQTEPGVELALGNLGDPAAVDAAIRGADVVIHAGAALKGSWTDHECATVHGTQNVLDACLKHGVRKLVHVSSMSVVDWAGSAPQSPIEESSPLEPRPLERGHYTRAKLEAEQRVRRFSQQHDLQTVIVRPGQIYGNDISPLTPAVARRIGRRWLVLGDGTLRLPLVHVDDVVDVIVSAATSTVDGSPLVQLVGDDAPTQNELLDRVLGKSASVLRIPRWLVFAAGRCSEPIFRLLGRPSPVSRYRLQSALARRTFRSTLADARGWSPRIGLSEGLRRANLAVSPHSPPADFHKPAAPVRERESEAANALAN